MEDRKYLYTILNKNTQKLETLDMRTGEVVNIQGEKSAGWVYTVEISDAIANEIRTGKTLQEVGNMAAFPPLHVIFNWRNYHPDFKQKLKDAKKDRAEIFHDKAVKELKEAEGISKDDVAAAKFRMDGYIKLAEKGDPEAYTPKPQLLQGGAAPAMIVINTGISREPITIEGEYEKICTDQRESDGLRGVHEESGRDEGSGSIGAELHGAEPSAGPTGNMADVTEEICEEGCCEKEYQREQEEKLKEKDN